MGFFEAMFEELGARRQRLQKALGSRTGGLVEFALLGGLILSGFAIPLGNMLGVVPILGFLVGYGVLDQRRQAALAGGADADALRKRSATQALIFTVAMSLLGYWVFGQAMAAKEVAGWTPPEPKVLNLDLE